jgi:phage protein
MNKKELIDYCNAIKENKSQIINCIDVNGIIKKIEQLDEPEKVKVPQFVAQYIEWTKGEDYHLLGAMIEIRSHKNKEIDEWFEFKEDDNMETFARAWLDGYEVEKEPKYTVKFKATNQYLCDDDGIGLHISPSFRSNFRKSDLEKLSLTEVFDSSLFEVEEV